MFIILKNDFIKKNKSIINIIYGNYDSCIKRALNDELNDMNDSNKDPLVSYIVDENSIILEKKVVKSGYLYNTEKITRNIIMTIEAIEYDTRSFQPSNDNDRLFKDLNTEINHRVLKSLDKDSLYQVFIILNKNLNIKKTWTNYDFINMLNDILKNFKKELYSSVAKKLNRYKFKTNKSN